MLFVFTTYSIKKLHSPFGASKYFENALPHPTAHIVLNSNNLTVYLLERKVSIN